MNIFVLSRDVEEAARFHLDKHVVKMPLETAQMLCTVHHAFGSHDVPYKSTHSNHPCTLWAGRSRSNYLWLVDLGRALCSEYTFRYGKHHKCLDVINSVSKPPKDMSDISLTDFALAMPDECKLPDPVEAYRNYYRMAKQHIAVWKNRPIPSWMTIGE